MEGTAPERDEQLFIVEPRMTPSEAVAAFGESWKRLAEARATLERGLLEALDASDEGIARLLEFEAEQAFREGREQGATELRRAARLIREVIKRRAHGV